MSSTDLLAHRRAALGVGAAAGAAALIAAAWSLSTGRGITRAATGFRDGGATVSWGLPATRLLAELAAVATLGLLVGAAVFSPRAEDGRPSPAASRSARSAAGAVLVWAATSAAQMAFVAADLSGRPLEAVDPSLLVTTALHVAQGRAKLVAAVAGLLVFGCAWPAARPGPLVAALPVTVIGTVAVAFAGHAASSLDHGTATISLAGHILVASVWVGGLGVLLLLSRWDRDALAVAAGRFSALAAVCFGAVAATGLLNAWLRVGSLDRLTGTGYAVLLQAKIFALLVLGGLGWWHRTSTLPALRERGERAGLSLRRCRGHYSFALPDLGGGSVSGLELANLNIVHRRWAKAAKRSLTGLTRGRGGRAK